MLLLFFLNDFSLNTTSLVLVMTTEVFHSRIVKWCNFLKGCEEGFEAFYHHLKFIYFFKFIVISKVPSHTFNPPCNERKHFSLSFAMIIAMLLYFHVMCVKQWRSADVSRMFSCSTFDCSSFLFPFSRFSLSMSQSINHIITRSSLFRWLITIGVIFRAYVIIMISNAHQYHLWWVILCKNYARD